VLSLCLCCLSFVYVRAGKEEKKQAVQRKRAMKRYLSRTDYLGGGPGVMSHSNITITHGMIVRPS
jgi:hypothetical protein